MDNIEKFIANNNIDVEAISKLPEAYVYDMSEVNPIVAKYAIYKDVVYSQKSIADIIGVFKEPRNYNKQNVVDNLDLYFSKSVEKTQTYNNRSDGMLNYDKNNVMSGLHNSCIEEPMVITELDNGKALITQNGMHRYHVFRTFYLDELLHATNDEEKNKLRRKYIVPIKIEPIDLVKTYSSFMLSLTGLEFGLKPEYSGLKQTGNSELTTRGNHAILTDERLIGAVRALLPKINVNSQFLNGCYEHIPSFQQYIDINFPELTSLLGERSNTR